jgi:hypothetical protein
MPSLALMLIGLFFGPAAPDVTPEAAAQAVVLIPKLGSDNFEDREQAERDILKIGLPLVRPLAAAALDRDPEIAHRVNRLLGQLLDPVAFQAGYVLAPRLVAIGGECEIVYVRVRVDNQDGGIVTWKVAHLPKAYSIGTVMATEYGCRVLRAWGITPGESGVNEFNDPIESHVQSVVTAVYLRELRLAGVTPLGCKAILSTINTANRNYLGW